MPPDLPALACLADCALHNIGSLCVYMGSYIFLYIQKCPEILPNQCEIASSAPVYPSLGFVQSEYFEHACMVIY